MRREFARHLVVRVLIPLLLVAGMPAPSHGWKPRMHAMTANVALADAADAHICLPGLSEEQIFLGETPLVGTYVEDDELKFFNDLAKLGPYVRSGSLGPDSFPDGAFGQLAIHVDHSRPEQGGELLMPDLLEDASETLNAPLFQLCADGGTCNPVGAMDLLRFTLGEELFLRLVQPLHMNPPMRSIDYGHEVMKRALRKNAFALAGRTREEILDDPFLTALQAEMEAAVAFANGYFMHYSGDSFAHTWVNEWVGQPFSFLTGRRLQQEYLDPTLGSPLTEELLHMATEKYLDVRYRPEVVGDTCRPADPQWVETATSLCDGGEPIGFPVDCDYCNPLRDGKTPPEVELSSVCDRCFEGCDPWREVCPPQTAPTLPCSECKELEPGVAACTADFQTCVSGLFADLDSCQDEHRECVAGVESKCAEQSENKCCNVLVDILEQSGILTEAEARRVSCENPRLPSDLDIADLIATGRGKFTDTLPAELQDLYNAYSPDGCYQGPIDRRFSAHDEDIEVDVGGGEVLRVNADGDWGLELDLNGDGERDLINECMLINCLQSPATCPLSALNRGLPQTKFGNELICDDLEAKKILENPDPLLNTHAIDMPRGVYKDLFLKRRYPDQLQIGSLGTTSLGGYVPNSVYMLADVLEVSADALEGLRHPMLHVANECVVEGSPECELAAKIAFVQAIRAELMARVVPALVLTAAAAMLLPPPIGIPIAAASLAMAGVIIAAEVIMRQGVIPGLTLPLRAKRAQLLEHLDTKWYDTIMETAHAMSGETCHTSCAGLFPVNEDCTEHRFLGLQNYFDWALEAYDIIDSLDCRENNYWTKINDWYTGSTDPTLPEIVDLVESGGTIILTQWLGCEVLDYLYTTDVPFVENLDGGEAFGDGLLPGIKRTIGEMILEASAGQICQIAGFYQGLLVDVTPDLDPDEVAWDNDVCVDAFRAAYGNPDDPLELVRNLRELVAALDEGGLTDQQKEVLYPQLEAYLRASTGVEVALEEIEEIAEVLDCAVALQPVIGRLDAREWVFENLENLIGEEATSTLEAIDREIGNFKELVEEGFDELNPVPANVEEFYPLYNTLQLNKLILLGTDNSCRTRFEECARKKPVAECAAVFKNCIDSEPPAGLRALADRGNDVQLTGGFRAAYSSDTIDTDPETYLESFFDELGFEAGAHAQCEDVGWNVMCNSVYSLDDPDDYCRELAFWNQDFLDEIEPGLFDSEDRIVECAPALEGVDSYADDENIPPYSPVSTKRYFGPYSRYVTAPSGEPRLETEEAEWLSPASITSSGLVAFDPPHRDSPSHRSVALDRVVPQDFSRNQLVDWQARSRDRQDSYYPYRTTRFSLTNKDSHVARLYSNIFAPYYCPEMGDNQTDWDCDTIPDKCDNCPRTYNPDQLDSNRDGAGEDCPGYSPFTGDTPYRERWSLCPSRSPIWVVDPDTGRRVRRFVVGQGPRRWFWPFRQPVRRPVRLPARRPE